MVETFKDTKMHVTKQKNTIDSENIPEDIVFQTDNRLQKLQPWISDGIYYLASRGPNEETFEDIRDKTKSKLDFGPVREGIVFQADKRGQIITALYIWYSLALRRPNVKTFEDTEMHVTKEKEIRLIWKPFYKASYFKQIKGCEKSRIEDRMKFIS